MKTQGNCEEAAAAAPGFFSFFGATAVFTVTAVKLPWERERQDREGDMGNNRPSCNLETGAVTDGEEEVCVYFRGGVEGRLG